MTNNVVPFQTNWQAPGVAMNLPALQQLSPEAMSHFQEGLASLQVAEAEKAVEQLSRVVELAPQFPEARICLGLAFALSYNIYPALDHLQVAGELDPESFAAHFTLAQLYFKLRIPQKGYTAAQHALKCVTTLEQRKMLAQLLREERARERNGIARPWFNKPFSRPLAYFLGSGAAALVMALLVHVRW